MKPWRAELAVGASTVGTMKGWGGGGPRAEAAADDEGEAEEEEEGGLAKEAIRSRSRADMNSKTDFAEALMGGSVAAAIGGCSSSGGLVSPRIAPRYELKDDASRSSSASADLSDLDMKMSLDQREELTSSAVIPFLLLHASSPSTPSLLFLLLLLSSTFCPGTRSHFFPRFQTLKGFGVQP
jgi:hypothetical protein